MKVCGVNLLALAIVALIIGIVFLILGADFLVKGAASIAAIFKIPEYAIGATLVAFGTSAPELFASVYASLINKSDIALSNVIGSNLINIALIIGLTAAINPIRLKRHIFEKDATHFIFSAIALIVISANLIISRAEGFFLVALLIVYTTWLLRQKEEMEEIRFELTRSMPISIIFIASGLIILVIGSRLTISGAVSLAQILNVSQWIIGSIVLALGTSLPELFTSALAAIRKKPEIAIGNVIGSNIFNIYNVLGLSAIAKNIKVEKTALMFDIPVNFILSLGLLIMIYDRTITRENGLTLLLVYGLIVLTIIQIH